MKKFFLLTQLQSFTDIQQLMNILLFESTFRADVALFSIDF